MKISVIVPVYNKEKYISKTLESLDKQTSNDFEVIIIDDASTDNSMEYIRDFEHHTKKQVRVLKNNQNLGVSETRNIGIDEAECEYVVFVDGDDYLDKNFIKIANAKLKKNPNVDILRSRIILVENGKKISDGRIKGFRDNQIIVPRRNRDYIIRENASCNGKVYHKSLLDNIVFNKGSFEDYEFTLETLISCNELINVNGLKYYYQLSNNGRYFNEKNNIKNNCIQYMDIHERLDEKYLMSSFLEETMRLKKIKTCFTYLRMIRKSNLAEKDKDDFIKLYLTYLKNHDGLDSRIFGDGRDIASSYILDELPTSDDYDKIKRKLIQIASKY